MEIVLKHKFSQTVVVEAVIEKYFKILKKVVWFGNVKVKTEVKDGKLEFEIIKGEDGIVGYLKVIGDKVKFEGEISEYFQEKIEKYSLIEKAQKILEKK